MAFAFRKIISNIGYFKKSDEDGSPTDPLGDLDSKSKQHKTQLESGDAEVVNFECTEPDSTSIQNSVEISSSLYFPETMKKISVKKDSLSDTDLLNINLEKSKKEKKKKLKVDVKKANQSFDENLNRENVENTPKHVLLECKSSEIFSERMKKFDFSNSFELDTDTDSSFDDENLDIESLSDISLESDDKGSIKMCRKVGTESAASDVETELVPSATPESFGDVEVDKNEEERVALLVNYQQKFEKLEYFTKKLLTEFQFHIEVSKIFNSKTFVSTLPASSKMPKMLGEVTSDIDNIIRGVSPTGSWNIIMEKEDETSKIKLTNQLQSIQSTLDNFVKAHLKNQDKHTGRKRPLLSQMLRSMTYDVIKGIKTPKKLKINNKKKVKHFEYPDIRDAMLNLFSTDTDDNDSSFDVTDKCVCRCHESSPSQTDSGLKMKTDDRSMSITSSIGNFSLDTSTLTAYSESLEQIISYSSFDDTGLFSLLLQKAAIERITFYVQAHSIEIKCETSDDDTESKNIITFYCPACKITESEENDLLKHILSQIHCENIHFLYKKAYIKKCVAAGKEIQPSTVLNPMKMYRDDNKIVCFGDAIYACSLCFENVIVGESVLMAHCSDPEHVDKREKLMDNMIE